MTGVTPPSMPPPRRRTRAPGRLVLRRAAIGSGVLLAFGVLLLLAGSPLRRPVHRNPLARPTSSGRDADLGEPPAGASGRSLHDRAARARRRVETANSELSATFDCKPVRKDEAAAGDQYPVPRPPFTEGIYPCTRCHDRPDDFNTTKRTLTLEHTDIKLVHGPREQWCYDCHNPTFRDKLRLAGGRLVSFEKSYLLCGQCHGPKLRDWRLGIHGRRVGCWNGKRQYLSCVHCHSPHAPAFPKIKPKPRPVKPSEIRPGGER